jgi:aminoglycoside 6'-N-acetyltransferase
VLLRGPRVALRPLEASDLDAVAAILQEPDVRKWWGAHDLDRVRRDLLDDPDVTAFTIEVEGELAGLVMYSEENDADYRHAGIDISLATAHQGQGLGPEALRVLARHLFEERGHHRLTIDPAASNERAIRAYQRVGFRPVGLMRDYERGLDGTWHDGLLMDLLARDFAAGN